MTECGHFLREISCRLRDNMRNPNELFPKTNASYGDSFLVFKGKDKKR